MNNQCQARTTQRTHCQYQGVHYARVVYSDGIREFFVCARHFNAIKRRVFRPAINPPVIRELTQAEKINGEVSA